MIKRPNHTLTLLLVIVIADACFHDSSSPGTVEKTTKDHAVEKIGTLTKRTVSKVNAEDFTTSPYQNTTSSKDISISADVQQDFQFLQPAGGKQEVNKQTAADIFHVAGYKSVLVKPAWLLSITFDNDIFDNTDYYYTNGVSISLTIPSLRLSPINKIFPSPKHADVEFFGLSLTQNMYTPTNPDTEDILYGDRPFSAYLTLGQFREMYDLSRNIYIKSQINLGVLGPYSLGGQVQSTIHEITPVGWVNQIDNDLVINYSIRMKKGLVNSSVFDLNLDANADLGSLYDKIGGGFDLRFGSFMPFYQDPVTVFEHPDDDTRLQCWFFLKSTLDFVAYDATLQGGLFNRNNIYTIDHSDINRFVFRGSAGFVIYYKNVGFEFENFFMTPEFQGARKFAWGRIKAVLAF